MLKGDQILKVPCRLPAEEAVSIYFDLNLGKMAGEIETPAFVCKKCLEMPRRL